MADLKQLARRIFQETLAAIDIPAAMQRKLQRAGTRLRCDGIEFDLRAFERVFVVAIGKAAHAMVEGLTAVLGPECPFNGIVAAPTAPERESPGIHCFAAAHPLPDAESHKAADAILELLKACDQRTLVFFLLSGGGSALVESPLEPALTVADMQQLYRVLVTCGASIGEIGKVRRHVSAVKGGRLAVAAGRATKITLAVSDVPAGQEAALASGPTIPDPTTIADALEVLRQYAIEEKLSPALRQWIQEGKMPETPKPGDAAFADAHFSLLLGMDDLFHPAHRAAESAGCLTCCDNTTDDWPVERAAAYLLEQLDELRRIHHPQRVALIADGEVSSPVTGHGVCGEDCGGPHRSAERGDGWNGWKQPSCWSRGGWTLCDESGVLEDETPRLFPTQRCLQFLCEARRCDRDRAYGEQFARSADFACGAGEELGRKAQGEERGVHSVEGGRTKEAAIRALSLGEGATRCL